MTLLWISLFLLFLGKAALFFLWPSDSLEFGLLAYEWLLVAGLPLALARFAPLSRKKLFPFARPSKNNLLQTALMTIALAVVIDTLLFFTERLIPPPPEVGEALRKIMAADSGGQIAWRLFLICLTPAVCEEIYFRGFFQNLLGRALRPKTAFILTGILFALIHDIPWYWHLYLILGFYLSWLLYRSGNLWLPILAHFLNNTWTFLNDLLGTKVPHHETFQAADAFVFGTALLVFTLTTARFSRSFPSPKQGV